MNETVTGASTTWGQRQDYVEIHGGSEHFLLLNLLILAAALPWFGGLDHSTNCYFAAYDRDWCASMLGKRTVPEESVCSVDISINLFLVDISPAVCNLQPYKTQIYAQIELLMPHGSQLRHVCVPLDRYLCGKFTDYFVLITFSDTNLLTHSPTDANSLKLI